MLKENKGVTLVALVITIIVLLILAGVTLSMVVGNNGLFTRAKDSDAEMAAATAKEKVSLAVADVQAGAYADNKTYTEASAVIDAVNASLLKEDDGYSVDKTTKEIKKTAKDTATAIKDKDGNSVYANITVSTAGVIKVEFSKTAPAGE